jgi:two-component system OmpR family sensor kinase
VSTRSLVQRLSTVDLILAGALILIFAGSAIGLSARTLEREEISFLNKAAAQLAENLDREWQEEGDLRRAAASAMSEDEPPGVDFDVLAASGRQIFSTRPAAKPRPIEHRRSVRAPLRSGAWIVASVSTEPRRHAVVALATAIALTAVPLFIASALLSGLVARRELRPLSRITADADEATRRGFLSRLEHPSDPAEVATLAAAFDRLFRRLDETLRAERHFTQDAAHELRTPLTVLSGELEYALQDSSLPERHRPGLERAFREVTTLSNLVEALLLLRRADSDPLRGGDAIPVNLGDVVRNLAREIAARQPERAADLSVAAPDEAFATGHAVLLAAAIGNLLSNAFKFTRAGQSIRVTVTSGDDQCSVVVEDAGPGVPPSDRERVFDPFYRGGEARSSFDGVGLGLPILRRVARAHGGDVRLDQSTLGGARFELSLPAWTSRRTPS